MAVRLDKPWLPVADVDAVLKGHLGVFQLADADDQIILIGYAGGKSLFGLKGEVSQAIEQHAEAVAFRVEITSSYLSRFRELMMVHIADHGEPPILNEPITLGRMSPG